MGSQQLRSMGGKMIIFQGMKMHESVSPLSNNNVCSGLGTLMDLAGGAGQL